MTWESELKPIITKEWEEKIKLEPELATKPGAALAYRNLRIGRIYNESSQAVKDSVEEFRKKRKGSASLSPHLEPGKAGLPDQKKEHLIASRVIKK